MFEGRYMAVEDPDMHELIEASVELPSCLTDMECALVRVLLTGEHTREEIAAQLGIGRKRAGRIHRSVQEKLADWAPGGYFTARSVVVPPAPETWPIIEHEPEHEPVIPADLRAV